ncbi:MAG: DUF5722 domain-containing protein [Verrucomicrobiota bacterium]
MRFALFCLLLASPLLSGSDVPLSWGPHKDLKAKAAEGGAIEITLEAGDPHFWTGVVPKAFDPEQHRVFEMDYFAPSGMESAILRFRIANGDMVIAGSEAMPLSETWQPWTFDMSRVPEKPAAQHPEMRFHIALNGKAGSVMRIRNLRVREMNAEELKQVANREQIKTARLADDQRIHEYIEHRWPARIDSVEVGEQEITVLGNLSTPVRVIGIAPETPSHLSLTRGGDEVKPDAEGRFKLSMPRIDPATQRDRAIWRWRLAEAGSETWVSSAAWPTKLGEALGGKSSRMTVKTRKGLGGVPPIHDANHEIFQLSIGHATLNMVVNALLRDKPAPGHAEWKCDGRTYYYNENMIHGTDITLRNLHEKGIIVSCILLVGNHRHADGTPHSPMTHPEAEARGIYAMPNLTQEDAARLYAAAIRLLAERYDGGPDHPGRISQWILHNEIDQAGTWTNMGDQPLARYLEAYMRSARVVHHTAQLFDRQSRVFMSLTHHWTKQSSGTGTYVVRDMVELFASMARAEGDFEWGVAYHPYPRDLRNPDTWNDTELTADFDTPYITPKNIEVLPAFLKQERFLYQGKPRGILLSEQGFNSPTLSERDQWRQAAGLVYVFRKLKSLPEIEAYHLHRYQDAPAGEGGLRLGIITETGAHKVGWDVYREIGTGSEAETEFEEMAERVMTN